MREEWIEDTEKDREELKTLQYKAPSFFIF